MSLIAAVDTAVRLQVMREKKMGMLDYLVPMNGPIAAAGAAVTGYGYDAASMLQLLEQISVRLRIELPPLQYDWNKSDIGKCLAANMLTLVSLIASDVVVATGT